MVIHYQSLLQLKNDYVKARKEWSEQGKKIERVVVMFNEPIALHYSKYYSGDKILTVHTVKRLAFSKNGICNCEYEPETIPDTVLYSNGRQRTSAYVLPMRGLVGIELVEKTLANSDYSKQWQAIANSMRKYGINPKSAEAIEKHLRGETEHIEGYQNYWKKTDKPRVMSFADVLSQFGWDAIVQGKEYTMREYRKAKTDAINARAIPEMVKSATDTSVSNGEYKYHSIRKHGSKRDRSVSVQVYKDGTIRYYSASEYAGCGNGDYYEMYSPTMAFYCETD